MDFGVTGRYLTETESSGSVPARGKERDTQKERKGSIQWELHWRGWDALSVRAEGWTEGGQGSGGRENKGAREEKNNGEERGKEETFQPVFSIQRHFDRAEPTLWQGVEPFWSLLPAAWGKQGARIDISRGCLGFFLFSLFFPSPSTALSFPFFDSQLRIAEQVSSHFLLKQWDSAHKHSIAVHKQINTWADQTDRQTDTHTLAHTYKHSGGTQEVTMHWKWLPFTHNAFHTAAEVERGRESVCAGGGWEEGVGGTICDYLHWHKMSVRKQSAIFTLMHANNRQPLTQGRDLVCSAIFRSQEKEG